MRSKTLLVSNILSSVYAAILLWIVGGSIISAGGLSYINFWRSYFSFVSDFAGYGSLSANTAAVVLILLCVHIILFTLGAIFGWLSFGAKKSGLAKFAATLYLIGTLCFPIYIFFGLPLTIIGYIGGGKQKKLIKNEDLLS